MRSTFSKKNIPMILSTLETYVVTPVEIICIILSLSAILLGIVSLARRERDLIIVCCIILTGIACAGIGLSTWLITRISWNRFEKVPIDPIDTFNQYAFAFYPVTWIMFACAMGYVLCGVSYQLSVNRKTHQKSEAEQAAP